ncbi:hypothetical protein [Humidisolicoccus flavus]|uniref:hypothetical protein n=1 Tax=Humidisolicoccus flavus TaxID=3111414 RepID=UPI00324900E5
MTVPPNPIQEPNVLWACVEDGFYVGSRNGEFLGYIDRKSEAQYLAFDMFSREVGVFPDLRAATTVLNSSGFGDPVAAG